MTRWIFCLAIISVTCSKSRDDSAVFIPLQSASSLAVYEGMIPTMGGSVSATLSLEPGTINGQARYRVEVIIPTKPLSSYVGSGKYETEVLGDIVSLTLKDMGVRAGVNFDSDKSEFGFRHLRLVTTDGNILTIVSHDSYSQRGQQKYLLFKRYNQFTAEGYFTFYPTGSDFFERNTGEKWPVAKQGVYEELVKYHHSLSKDKFEGIFVRGLAYSIKSIDGSGKEFDSIVFKNITRIDSASLVRPI